MKFTVKSLPNFCPVCRRPASNEIIDENGKHMAYACGMHTHTVMGKVKARQSALRPLGGEVSAER